MDFFYAATTIAMGDGHIAKFWHAPWLGGLKPKYIAPSIFTILTWKNFTVGKGITNDFWILNTSNGMSLQHISEFVDLWTWISEVNLVEGTTYDIIWKFTTLREYSATSAYQAQFEGMTRS